MPLARLPITGSDANTWSDILNRNITQTNSALNGAFNSFDQFSQRPINLTADDAGRTYLYTQTGNWHEWSGSEWKVQNKSEINVKDYGAIGDGVTDDTTPIQFCIDYSAFVTYKKSIFIPQGKYRITNTLNLTANGLDRHNINLNFENRSSQYSQGTLLIGETGSKPVIETTGTDGTTITNCGIIAGQNNPSQIGILQARSAVGTFWCHRHKYTNLYVNLNSNILANNGLGTIGILNIAAEESEYSNIEIWANICFVASNSKNIRVSILGGSGANFKNFNAISSFNIPLADGASTTVHNFTGANRLISFDFFSPALLFYYTASVNLGSTYINKISSGGNNPRNYSYAIELWSCTNFYHMGNIEGCGQYMLLRAELTNAFINVTLTTSDEGNVSNQPLLLCWDIGSTFYILNSTITINFAPYLVSTINKNQPLIGTIPYNSNPSSKFLIKNTTFKDNRNYDISYIDTITAGNSTNSIYYFNNQKIEPNNFIEGSAFSNVRTVTIKGDGGTNTADVFTANAFGTKGKCIAAFDSNNNSVATNTPLSFSDRCTFVVLVVS